jgi:hypothetical protein
MNLSFSIGCILLLIILIMVINNSKDNFYPQRINTCSTKDNFVSDRRGVFEKRFFNIDDKIDVRFPTIEPGMVGTTNRSGPTHAGSITLGGFAEKKFSELGNFNTTHTNAEENLKVIKLSH